MTQIMIQVFEKVSINDRATRDRVDQLKMMFMQRNPWWACVVVDVPILVQNYTQSGHFLGAITKVAATDGRCVYLMPEFFRSAPVDVISSVINHEYQHIIRMHSYRMGDRDSKNWNIACDHVVNLDILGSGGILPEGGFHDKKYSGWDEERIYADLINNPQPDQGEAQPLFGDGSGGSPSDHGVVIKAVNDDGSPMTEDQVARAVDDMKSKITMAQSMMKGMGAGDSPGSRMLSELVEPKRNWREEMRLFVSRKGKPIGRSWNRLDRRSMSQGVLIPAEVKEGMDWVVIGMDVSGSTSQRESDAFIANFTKIRNSIPIKRMTIVPFDTDVIEDGIVDLKKGGKYNHEFRWGGGTNVQGLFDWISKSKGKPECVIIFTDMDFNYGFNSHGIQPLWASSVPIRSLGKTPKCGRVIEIGL